MRVVLLNAFPVSAVEYSTFTALFKRVAVEELVEDVRRASEVVSYIRHPATVQLLSKLLGIALAPSAELYRYREHDLVYVITLKTPTRGQEVTEVKPEDLDVVRVVVVQGGWI
jgi:hypothetical protein